MGSQEGRLCTDSNRELLKLILGTAGSSVLQGIGDIALERTEGICFVARCDLKTIFSVCHCCFAESVIEVNSVPRLMTKNGVMSAERRVTRKFLN